MQLLAIIEHLFLCPDRCDSGKGQVVITPDGDSKGQAFSSSVLSSQQNIGVKPGSESLCGSYRICLDTRPKTSPILVSLHTLCMWTAVTAKFFHEGLTPQRPQSHGFNPPSAEHQHVVFGPPGSQEATINCETIVKWQLVTTGSTNVCVGWSNPLERKTKPQACCV